MVVLLVLFLAAGAQTAMHDAPAPSFATELSTRDGHDR